MSRWLDPLHRALQQSRTAPCFFFRDDDAGWDDTALYRLLDLFQQQRMPIDLAVIPQALHAALADGLLARHRAGPDLLGLHQHGYCHANHEAGGRKHEFGPGRSYRQQLNDIAAGRARLQSLLGHTPDAIFTPPWNRCTAATAEALLRLGYRMLSRDATAPPLPPCGLAELPVSIDWLRRHKGVRISRDELGQSLAARVRMADANPIGIMLHHAAMDNQDLKDVAELLKLLRSYDTIHCHSMRYWLAPA
jgi:peptidoglycan/xylan/chitin deacetylase (PgdA/CDA1 family)